MADKNESFARHNKTDDELREAKKTADANASSKDQNSVHFFEYDNEKSVWNSDWAGYRNVREE
jgi:hypothetical protein